MSFVDAIKSLGTKKNTAEGRKRTKLRRVGNSLDVSLILMTCLLLVFGLLMIYSASSYEANLDWGDSAYYFKKQAFAVILGLFAMVGIGLFMPSRLPERVLLPIMFVAFGLVMLLPVIGHASHGATRWIRLGPLSIQPAEIVKVAIIIFEATFLTKYMHTLHTWKGFLYSLIVPIVGLLFVRVFSNNLSSGLIIFLIGLGMVFIASYDYKKYALGVLGILIVAVIIYFALSKVEYSGDKKVDFRGERLIAWVNPEAQSDDLGYQTMQSLYAIGSGGLTGKGLGQSVQKMNFIPEAQNDMIFSIICEELGLVGAIIVFLMYIGLIGRMYLIARSTRDLYKSLLVVGVMMQITIQVLLNVAVVTNTIPNTGVSLPFISYGGSSVTILLAEIGLVLAVQRENAYEEDIRMRKRMEAEEAEEA
ncbi:MAG: putative lipid II flippase FtsW [Lachnospiraceae bacterium]|nr:putative lipid II flippase FtsW [Lachnospiraceae bacterium]